MPLLMPVSTFRVAAIAKLHNYPDSYLYVARGVSPKVVTHLRNTERGVTEYEQLRERRGGLKFAHGLMYFMISLTALLAAVWVGLWFAGLLVAPIRRLISAAQQVAKGNLSVQLPIRRGEGDLGRLSMNFNTMTQELERQRERSGDRQQPAHGTAPVHGGGAVGRIRRRARPRSQRAHHAGQPLGAEAARPLSEDQLVGRHLADAVPEFAGLLVESADPNARGRPQRQVTLTISGDERSFAVRVTHEAEGEGDEGSVLTFDDVTELVSAQRTSAWADVARRIAHEIKNPLTPIQLSAERIKRKYGKVITEDREVFDLCTDTIIRQVGDVTRMVDEFSAFARMPKPQMEEHDIRDVVRASVLDRQMANGDIAFDKKFASEPIIVSCDRRLISQAIHNLVKNAEEAIQAYAESPDKEPGWRGRIETIVRRNGTRVDIEVIDNGPGLPKHNRTRLLEPYVTTKGHRRAPASASPSCRKAWSSTAARSRWRTPRRARAALTARCCASPCRSRPPRAGPPTTDSPHPPPRAVVRDRQRLRE